MNLCPSCKTELPASWARSTCPECGGRLPAMSVRRAPVLSPLQTVAHDQARTRASERPPTGRFPSVPPGARPATGRFPSIPAMGSSVGGDPRVPRLSSSPPPADDKWDVDDAGASPAKLSSGHVALAAPRVPAEFSMGATESAVPGRDESFTLFSSGASSDSLVAGLESARQRSVARTAPDTPRAKVVAASDEQERTNPLPVGSRGAKSSATSSTGPADAATAAGAVSPTNSLARRADPSGEPSDEFESVTVGAPVAAIEALAREAEASEKPQANLRTGSAPSLRTGMADGAARARTSSQPSLPSVIVDTARGGSYRGPAPAASAPPVPPREARASSANANANESAAPKAPAVSRAPRAVPSPQGRSVAPVIERVLFALAGFVLACAWVLSGPTNLMRLGTWGLPGVCALALAGLTVGARDRALLCAATAFPAVFLSLERASGSRAALLGALGVLACTIAGGLVVPARWPVVLIAAGAGALLGYPAGVLTATTTAALALLAATAGTALVHVPREGAAAAPRR